LSSLAVVDRAGVRTFVVLVVASAVFFVGGRSFVVLSALSSLARPTFRRSAPSIYVYWGVASTKPHFFTTESGVVGGDTDDERNGHF